MTVLAELRMRAAGAHERSGWDASRTARLAISGTVLFTLLLGANLATPLYPLIQAGLGLDALGISLAFASYVLSLIAVLLLAGHWSDHIGRRAALVLAVLVSIAGGLVFASAENLWQLCAGRALQGVSVALATGAGAAALRELLPHRPEWAARFTLLASSGGVALGPAVGGVLSLLPAPTVTPFLVHGGLLLLLLVPVLLVKARPASLPAAPDVSRALLLAPRRPAVARPLRGTFWLAATTGFLSFAVFGYFLSLAPGYFSAALGIESRPLSGLLAGVTLAASAGSQLLRLPAPAERIVVPIGLALLGVSMLVVGWSASVGNGAVLVVASSAAGLGQGLAFRSLFNDVAGKVTPALHAQTVSALYAVTYLGSAVPVVGLGALSREIGVPAASGLFVIVCAILAGALSVAAVLTSQRRV